MKLNLKTDQVVSEDHSYGRGVYFYKSGGFAVQIEDPNATATSFPIVGSVMVRFNTGDQLDFVPDGNEYRLVRVVTHDGITWNERKTTILPAG